MNNGKFKNAPIHDKKAIIEMMDELEPKDMIEVVELLKSKQKKADKQQTVVDRIVNLLNKEGFAPVLTEEEIRSFKEMEKERIETAYNKGTVHGIDYPESKLPITGEQYYNETFGGNNEQQ